MKKGNPKSNEEFKMEEKLMKSGRKKDRKTIRHLVFKSLVELLKNTKLSTISKRPSNAFFVPKLTKIIINFLTKKTLGVTFKTSTRSTIA